MLSRVFSATILGIKPILIEVEVDSKQGIPSLILIGLPSKTIDEAKERITMALRNCQIRIRSRRTIVNLAPADLKKTGSTFELAIAVGILKMYGEIKLATDQAMFFGELSLDGRLKKINGALPLVLAAKEMGFQEVYLPRDNTSEVSVVKDITIFPLDHLQDLIEYSHHRKIIPAVTNQKFSPNTSPPSHPGFSHIRGQEQAKRALEIAAAGSHNFLMTGPPGAGKTLLAQAITSILPPLTEKEAIDITNIYSICGLVADGLINHRPFRAPHHTTSHVGLVGGGSNLKPGEISLAHHGILFLDELPEFSRECLETLRQPLEDGQITISRAIGSATFPANFTLLATANPCPCGYFGCLHKACSCTPTSLSKYQRRISGPILDRIDMNLFVPELKTHELYQTPSSPHMAQTQILTRVIQAREKQAARYQDQPYVSNSQLPTRDIKKMCRLSSSAEDLLHQAHHRLGFSARGFFKIIKISQTISDLEASPKIEACHLAEALQYRQLSPQIKSGHHP